MSANSEENIHIENEQLNKKISELEKQLKNYQTEDSIEKDIDLEQLKWMLKSKNTEKTDSIPEYGDLSELNKDGLILTSVGKEELKNISSEYLDLLETSAAIYELNGDYALGIFSSGWCRLMDDASRKLCNTKSNQKALESGKWLCHESCWKDASLECINKDKPIDIECNGGINMYAVPVKANGKMIGAINFGYGSPPTDEAKLKELSKKYKIPVKKLLKEARSYEKRPPFIIDLAKQRIKVSASRIGHIIEIKQAELEKQQSEENLRITLNSIGDAVIATDVHGRITQMNPVAEKLTGWSLEQALGQHIDVVFKIVNAQTGQRVENPVKKVLETGKIVGLANHTKLISKEGKEYQIADSGSPIKNSKGEKVGVVLVFRDVTDEYEMVKKLTESEQKYRTIFENTGTATTILEKDGTISLANTKFAELSGYPIKEIENKKKWMEFVVPEDLERMQLQQELRRKNHQEALTKYEFRFIDKNKQIKEIYLTIDMIPGTDKSVASLLDITEKIKTEKALQQNEERFRKIVEGAPTPIFIQTEMKFSYLNPVACKLFGIKSPDELLGTSVMERFHPDFHDQIYERIQRLNEDRQSVSNLFEQKFIRVDGSEVWVETVGEPINYKGKDGALVFVRDISERKKADDELLRLKENLESEVEQKTKELQERVNELERFQEATIEREFRIKELRDEIERLKSNKN